MISWTLVARGRNGKGLRFMFQAVDVAAAHKEALRICGRRMDFVAVFQGHMAALIMVPSRRRIGELKALKLAEVGR